MAAKDKLEKIADPSLREALTHLASAVMIKTEKRRCAQEQIPYYPPGPPLNQFDSKATPETIALTKRMTAERDLPDPLDPKPLEQNEDERVFARLAAFPLTPTHEMKQEPLPFFAQAAE